MVLQSKQQNIYVYLFYQKEPVICLYICKVCKLSSETGTVFLFFFSRSKKIPVGSICSFVKQMLIFPETFIVLDHLQIFQEPLFSHRTDILPYLYPRTHIIFQEGITVEQIFCY